MPNPPALAVRILISTYPSTINSHRLVALAEKKGLQDRTVEELFKTYFEKNDNIGDINVLADVGARVGLNKEEVCRLVFLDNYVPIKFKPCSTGVEISQNGRRKAGS